MCEVHAEEMLLFPITLLTKENTCEKCKVNPTSDKWNVCFDCLVKSGGKATLTVTLCVDCFKSPVEWRNKKTYMERQLSAQGVPYALVEMDFIHSGQCPVCEIRRHQHTQCPMDKIRIPDGMEDLNVTFDEYIEIRAARIVSELTYKRKKKMDIANYKRYEKKLDSVIEKLVVKNETKQVAKNAGNIKAQSILKKPSFFLSKSDFESIKDDSEI